MGDRGRHFAQGGQAVSKSFAFLELFDSRQVLEQQGRPRHGAVAVGNATHRVADRLPGRPKPQFRAVWERGVGERQREHLSEVVVPAQHLVEGLTDVPRRRLHRQDAVGSVVHDRDGAVAPYGDDPVAQAVDDVAIELFSVNHRVVRVWTSIRSAPVSAPRVRQGRPALLSGRRRGASLGRPT